MDLKRFIRNRLSVITKKAEPQKTFKGLSRDERSRVADNSSIPPAVLQELVRDADEYVRRSVVHNPNTRG